MFELALLLNRFYRLADWNQATADYVARERLKFEAINAHAGALALIECRFQWPQFHFDADGQLAAVIEVLGEDGATTLDLAAWPLDAPEKIATACGVGAILGSQQLVNPASWFCRPALPVHRTGLSWLRASCDGIAVVDYVRALPAIAGALGPLQAEDVEHARDLAEMFARPAIDKRNILYPAPARRAA